jgi:Type II secretion system (T2SS), protein E, N-terminal domain
LDFHAAEFDSECELPCKRRQLAERGDFRDWLLRTIAVLSLSDDGESMESSAKALRDLPLGSLLLRDDLVRPDLLRDALVEGRQTGRRLGEVLLARGLVGERDLWPLLAEQEGLEFVDLGQVDVREDAVTLVPERVARACGALAFAFEGDVLLVAVADPTDEPAMETYRAAVTRRVRFVVATPSEVAAAQHDAYAGPSSPPPGEHLR